MSTLMCGFSKYDQNKSNRHGCLLLSKVYNTQKHRDSENEWRGSCEIKIDNLEFSRLLTNLEIESEI